MVIEGLQSGRAMSACQELAALVTRHTNGKGNGGTFAQSLARSRYQSDFGHCFILLLCYLNTFIVWLQIGFFNIQTSPFIA
ncbi:hypothetical protein H6F95_16505 [Cyanobacteria bacterium FACHB-471]|nr:hypothetical protein [Cyanobacteria bacterium FACHB-471]